MTINIRFMKKKKDTKIGISLMKNKNDEVVVKKLCNKYLAKTLKINDILYSINGMPCLNVQCTIEVMRESNSFILCSKSCKKQTLWEKLIKSKITNKCLPTF